MPLPDALLRNVADDAGGKVVLVTGAGCSVEPPTSLLLSSDLSERCYQELIDDGVLQNGDVVNPRDLTEVADAVFDRIGGQTDLVDRFPRRGFKAASPNPGHLIAAALLKENAINSIITLNFDDALSAAVSTVDASDVEILFGPDDFANVGTNNLVYLHRHASADPEEWILRSDQLESAWRDSSQQVLAQRLLASPVVVFVGLGSPAAVLVESVRRIKEAVGNGCHVCYVDPGDASQSEFATAVGPDSTVEEGWVSFMDLLAARVARKQRTRLERACVDLAASETWQPIDVSSLLDGLEDLGLLKLGKIRSVWFLEGTPYVPDVTAVARSWIADFLITIAVVTQASGMTAHLREDGLVEFRDGRSVRHIVALAHGRGSMGWARLDAALNTREQGYPQHAKPDLIIVSGVNGERIDLVAPLDIIGGAGEGDIVIPAPPSRRTTEELRLNPASAFGVIDDQ